MTKNEKDLKDILLKDLCGRLPHRPKIWFAESNSNDHLQSIWYANLEGWEVEGDNLSAPVYAVKPYLFPLSSMTEEQRKIYHELIRGIFMTSALINFEVLTDFFNKNHLDYRGLIPMGLAIDATGLNIY